MDETYWDEKYRAQDRLWSGNPNGVLLVEAAGLAPGQALDLGCGEGADALWLASRGWLVTAVDISRVALARAAAAGGDAKVSWTHGDLLTAPPPAGAFDLVSALYFPLPRSAPAALRSLLASVAPGGTLLVVGHDLGDAHHHQHDEAEFDPADYYRSDEIADRLGDGWTVEVNETRQRVSPAPPGSGHINDTVLRARRDAR
jgi:SAM-dependent methyltransferase